MIRDQHVGERLNLSLSFPSVMAQKAFGIFSSLALSHRIMEESAVGEVKDSGDRPSAPPRVAPGGRDWPDKRLRSIAASDSGKIV